MKRIIVFSIFLVANMAAGCATTTYMKYSATGNQHLCSGDDLGSVVVLPEVAWRKNQKESEQRELMAHQEIVKAFRDMPCGALLLPNGVKEFGKWSSLPDSTLLEQYSSQGADTIVIIRMEELTPRLEFTFSIPFLWSGSSEADFRMRVLSVDSASVILDMRVKRNTGGVFHLRGAERAKEDLQAALREIIESNIANTISQ